MSLVCDRCSKPCKSTGGLKLHQKKCTATFPVLVDAAPAIMPAQTIQPIIYGMEIKEAPHISELLNLAKEYEAKDSTMEFEETFNIDKLNHIVTNVEKYSLLIRPEKLQENDTGLPFVNPFTLAGKYLAKSKLANQGSAEEHGVIKTKYKQTVSHGRFFAKGQLSLQTLVREVRHTISREFYDDLDIKNAHPVFLQYFCQTLNIETPSLNTYINHRDEVLEGISPDKNVAKKVVLSLINGGYKDYMKVAHKSEWLFCFYHEMIKVRQAIATGADYDRHFEWYNRTRKSAKRSTHNPQGSYMNTLLCNFENRVLMIIWEALGKPINCVLCFDGLMIAKNEDGTSATTPELIAKLEKAVLAQTDCAIELAVKPMDDGFDMSGETIIPYVTETLSELDQSVADLITNTPFHDSDIADWHRVIHGSASSGSDFYKLENNLMAFNGNYYETRDDSSLLMMSLETMISPKVAEKLKKDEDGKKQLTAALSKLRNNGGRVGAIKTIEAHIKLREDIFDTKPHLLAFENGVWDMETVEFRKGKKEDLISVSTGYDWVEPSEADCAELDKLIKEILPVEDVREIVLQILSTTLYGRTLEHIVFFTGCGRNGKDTLTTGLLAAALGTQRFYNGNITSITGSDKLKSRGADVATASMTKKSAVVFNEPSKFDVLNGATLKLITGGAKINARQIYSNKAETSICGTNIIMCNSTPRISGIDNAILQRLIICPFPAQFLTPDEKAKLPADTPYLHLVNPTYKSVEWQQRMRCPLIKLLLGYFQKFKANNYILCGITKEMKDLTTTYKDSNDSFLTFFEDKYEFTESPRDIVRISDIFAEFKQTPTYIDMNRSLKRDYTRAKFIAEIKTCDKLRNNYKERYQLRAQGEVPAIDVMNAIAFCRLRDRD